MKKVHIYSTQTCQYCKMAKDFFAEKNVAYENFDVSEDHQKREEMIEMSGQMGVPVIVVFGEEGDEPQMMVGFDERKLAEMLGVEL